MRADAAEHKRAQQQVGSWSHLLSLDLDSGPGVPGPDQKPAIQSGSTTIPADIVCVAAKGVDLYLGLSDSFVAHHVADKHRRQGEPWSPCGRIWSCRARLALPTATGCPASLLGVSLPLRGRSVIRNGSTSDADPGSKSCQAAFIGTDCGCLLRLLPAEGRFFKLATLHEGAGITALACSLQDSDMHAAPDGGYELFSGDSTGKVCRTLLKLPDSADGEAPHEDEGSSTVIANFQSSVLSLELCAKSGRLLVSTTERIAVVDLRAVSTTAGLDDVHVRVVGSKPHKGQYTATFTQHFGPDSLISARPGGRLWVADGADGTVQTTLKFQVDDNMGSGKKAALGRLVNVGAGKVLTWQRSDGGQPTDAAAASAVALLDIESISVSREWTLSDAVVDVAFVEEGVLFLAQRQGVSAMTMHESALAMVRCLLAGSEQRLTRVRAATDSVDFLESMLSVVEEHREVLSQSESPEGLLALFRPLTDGLAASDVHTSVNATQAVPSSTRMTFRQWIAELEDTQALVNSDSSGVMFSCVGAPLANFPVAEGHHYSQTPAPTCVLADSSLTASFSERLSDEGSCGLYLSPQLVRCSERSLKAVLSMSSQACAAVAKSSMLTQGATFMMQTSSPLQTGFALPEQAMSEACGLGYPVASLRAAQSRGHLEDLQPCLAAMIDSACRGERSRAAADVSTYFQGSSVEELAQTLCRLCGEDGVCSKMWLSKLNHRWRPVPSFFRLLCALAISQPCRESIKACAEATDAGTADSFVAGRVADTLWEYALQSSDGSGEQWLTLAAPLPAPMAPVLLEPQWLDESEKRVADSPTQGQEADAITQAVDADAVATSQDSSAESDAAIVNALVAADRDLVFGEGFYQSYGHYVFVAEDGLFARHRDDRGEDMHGVVVSAKPLCTSNVGLYFEIKVEEVRPENMPDGLTVGVTATSPQSAAKAEPATAEHLPHTWTLGYDGQMWDATTGELTSISWDPRCLVEGDTVGVLVTKAEGEMIVFRNGVPCCPGPRGIPVGLCPLFAVVDLLGAARAVSWRPNATAPIG
eukprot:TRINITY_DN58107_c0_g3_i3.p1 TRINITY_DN58107_c0_g3~~TRINITY_DN58107_c0_g3_i3.p1  ORF type:complete len:1044 (-),score=101.90 TRINITY_DN58107_c0_g3_i3:44-3175(-)